MSSFNDFITNITDYYDSIAANKVRPLYDPAATSYYLGEDLQSRVTQNPNNINPVIVAGLELVMAAERSRQLKGYTPKDFFLQAKNEATSRKEQYGRLVDQINKAQGET